MRNFLNIFIMFVMSFMIFSCSSYEDQTSLQVEKVVKRSNSLMIAEISSTGESELTLDTSSITGHWNSIFCNTSDINSVKLDRGDQGEYLLLGADLSAGYKYGIELFKNGNNLIFTATSNVNDYIICTGCNPILLHDTMYSNCKPKKSGGEWKCGPCRSGTCMKTNVCPN